MNDVRLICVTDLKESTSISKNIDPELLEPYLEIGEGYYCTNILGDALTTELRSQITGNTLTELNRYLLTTYIRPLIAFSAWHEYLPFSHIKTEQKGEVKQYSDNSTNPDLEEIGFKRQALKDKITYYQKRLREYLEKNTNNFPLYRSTCTTLNNNNWNIYLGKSN